VIKLVDMSGRWSQAMFFEPDATIAHSHYYQHCRVWIKGREAVAQYQWGDGDMSQVVVLDRRSFSLDNWSRQKCRNVGSSLKQPSFRLTAPGPRFQNQGARTLAWGFRFQSVWRLSSIFVRFCLLSDFGVDCVSGCLGSALAGPFHNKLYLTPV
jgi:hypothetical protein